MGAQPGCWGRLGEQPSWQWASGPLGRACVHPHGVCPSSPENARCCSLSSSSHSLPSCGSGVLEHSMQMKECPSPSAQCRPSLCVGVPFLSGAIALSQWLPPSAAGPVAVSGGVLGPHQGSPQGSSMYVHQRSLKAGGHFSQRARSHELSVIMEFLSQNTNIS